MVLTALCECEYNTKVMKLLSRVQSYNSAVCGKMAHCVYTFSDLAFCFVNFIGAAQQQQQTVVRLFVVVDNKYVTFMVCLHLL